MPKSASVCENTSIFKLLSILVLTIAFAITQPYGANALFGGDISSEMREALKQALAQNINKSAQSLYSQEQPSPYWTHRDGLNKRGREALDVLKKAPEHGISEDRYDVEEIESLVLNSAGDEQRLAEADIRLSESLVKFAQDLKYGVSKPKRYDRLGVIEERPEAVETMRELVSAPDVAKWVLAQAPQAPVYESLRHTLATYQILKRQGGWPKLASGKSIKPGMTDPRVAQVRDILLTTGDLREVTQGNVYDDVLVEAVKRFQARHGIDVDGAVGPQTVATFNAPVDERIDQIRITMDRIRHLPDQLGEKYILVNIPGYQLTAYDGGKEAMKMKVIVGKPSRKTPIFSNAIAQTVFNPTWSVPRSIAVKDKLRKIQQDPSYLTRSGFTLTQHGQKIDPYSVDWSSVNRSNFNFGLRQASGRGNALGKVKFPIPDNQSVYLHDTSSRSLFKKDRRALSSGCIRVEHPEDLAKYVLNGNEGWDEIKVSSAYKSSRRQTVSVNPVPVHAVYWTAWVDEQGMPHFYQDIYKKDHTVISALGPLDTTKPIQLAAR